MGEDVELCLEVQVDPESKKILSNPEKCRSALLDVTVVKPKELEAFGTQRTNTLRADEVRKLITSLERRRRRRQKLLDKLKYEDVLIKVCKHEKYESPRRESPRRGSPRRGSPRRGRKPFTKRKERISSTSPIDDLERKDFIGIAESVEPLFCEIRRSLKNVETRITNMQDINLVISQSTVDESASEEFVVPRRRRASPFPNSTPIRNQSVYRVDTGPPPDLKTILLRQSRAKSHDKGDRIEGKCMCENCGIVGLLMDFQKRPLFSEFSDSPTGASDTQYMLDRKKKAKIYAPHVDDTGMKCCEAAPHISELSNKVKVLEQRLSMQEEKVVPKDYFKKMLSKMVTNLSPKNNKSKSDNSAPLSEHSSKKRPKSIVRSSKNYTGTKNTACGTAHSINPSSIPTTKKDKATITDDELCYGGNIWRWGEEILKPGIDLKNRIIALLNDMLGKLQITDKPAAGKKTYDAGGDNDMTSDILKNFMEQVNTKMFNVPTKATILRSENVERDAALQALKKATGKGQSRREPQLQKKERAQTSKNVDVSYVNPKLWGKRSPSDNTYYEQRIAKSGKEEFMKIVMKAKQHQKDVLWRNIWSQAKANGQSKEDKITIKIPMQNKDGKGGQALFETELTIGEVERILKEI